MSQPDDDKTRTHLTLTSGMMVSHYRIIEKIRASARASPNHDGEVHARVPNK